MIPSPGKQSWFPAPDMITLVLSGPLIPALGGHHHHHLGSTHCAVLHLCCQTGYCCAAQVLQLDRTVLALPRKVFSFKQRILFLGGKLPHSRLPNSWLQTQSQDGSYTGHFLFYHLVTLGKFNSFSAFKLMVVRIPYMPVFNHVMCEVI